MASVITNYTQGLLKPLGRSLAIVPRQLAPSGYMVLDQDDLRRDLWNLDYKKRRPFVWQLWPREVISILR